MKRKTIKATRVVRIGNARGVRIPDDWMNQLQAGDKVELSLRGKELVIRPAGYHPREGWEEAIRAVAEKGEDPLFEEFPPTQWDLTEWEW